MIPLPAKKNVKKINIISNMNIKFKNTIFFIIIFLNYRNPPSLGELLLSSRRRNSVGLDDPDAFKQQVHKSIIQCSGSTTIHNVTLKKYIIIVIKK